jgi:hypothetical protein
VTNTSFKAFDSVLAATLKGAVDRWSEGLKPNDYTFREGDDPKREMHCPWCGMTHTAERMGHFWLIPCPEAPEQGMMFNPTAWKL